MIGLTIPTRGDHPDLLARIITTSGLPAERVVVVDTLGGLKVPGATVVVDAGPVNIHRWWNTGIDALAAAGCTRVAVLNDDVVIQPDTLQLLAAAIDAGATLAHPGLGRMTGWCWMLDTASPVRPDEGYRWWYGDNQLWLDAAAHSGVTPVPPAVCRHIHGNVTTTGDPNLQSLAAADRKRFEQLQAQQKGA